MAKHHIFFIHGMGSYGPDWGKELHDLVRGLFGQFFLLKQHNLVELFEFHSVRYDQVFDAWRTQWTNQAQSAAQALVANGLNGGIATDLVKLAESPGGQGFLRTHVLDVLGYRFLKPIKEEVQREVENQILTVLDGSNENISYSIVAHSLGTAVVYETFHAMLTQAAGDGMGFPSAFLPHNVFNLASVAKLLWSRGGTPYRAVMAPNLAENVGWCFHLANFDHELDPVSHLGPFEPPDNWFRAGAPRDEVFRQLVLPAADVQHEHVHAIEHYLNHPSVHMHMLRQLTRPGLISKQEEQDALKVWRSKVPLNMEVAKTRTKLQNIGALASDDWQSRIAVLRAVREIAGNSALKGGEK